MTQAFVPLVPGALPAGGLTGSTRLKPISSTPAPFELADPARPKTESSSQTPHVQHGPPKITLERQGETITHIRVECSCGQVTELKCEY